MYGSKNGSTVILHRSGLPVYTTHNGTLHLKVLEGEDFAGLEGGLGLLQRLVHHGHLEQVGGHGFHLLLQQLERLCHGEHLGMEGVDLLALLGVHHVAPLRDGEGGGQQLLGQGGGLPGLGRAGGAGPGQSKLQ